MAQNKSLVMYLEQRRYAEQLKKHILRLLPGCAMAEFNTNKLIDIQCEIESFESFFLDCLNIKTVLINAEILFGETIESGPEGTSETYYIFPQPKY